MSKSQKPHREKKASCGHLLGEDNKCNMRILISLSSSAGWLLFLRSHVQGRNNQYIVHRACWLAAATTELTLSWERAGAPALASLVLLGPTDS